MQKDIPSEEIKTGEEDDDDNGDNLLKDSNDSESLLFCVVRCTSKYECFEKNSLFSYKV